MEHDPIRALIQKHEAFDTKFEVTRDDGMRHVASNELRSEEVAALTTEMRARYDADETRWAAVFAEIDRIAAEEEASKRDGETCVHNAEPDSRNVVECAAEAAG